MKLVVVSWNDAKEGRGAPIAKLQERESVGWLFHEDDEMVGLVHEADVETREDTYYSVIPASQINSVDTIEEGEEG